MFLKNNKMWNEKDFYGIITLRNFLFLYNKWNYFLKQATHVNKISCIQKVRLYIFTCTTF